MAPKTLHVAYRVSDLERALRFYGALGYEELGRVPLTARLLVMLALPGDDVVSLELTFEPDGPALVVGNGFSHLVVQVDDLEAYLRDLRANGVAAGEIQLPGGPDGPKTCFLADPDGYRIEVVQWPPESRDGLTRRAFLGA